MVDTLDSFPTPSLCLDHQCTEINQWEQQVSVLKQLMVQQTHLISRYAAGSHFVDVWCCCLSWRSIQMVCYSFSYPYRRLPSHPHTHKNTIFSIALDIYTSVRETTKNHTFLFPFRFSLGTAGFSRHTTFSLLPWERRSTTRIPAESGFKF